jgi:signal transduction histidine kinase
MSQSTIDNRLLIVDDEPGPRLSLEMIFKDQFSVTTAASGEEAIERFRESPCAIVITDIRMRGMNGIDVLREVKRIHPETEVIILTAFETLDTARQAISLGASDYLKKPFDLDHIQSVVGRCHDQYLFHSRQEALVRKNLNAAKHNFLEIISHELNTPMNGILGFIELLEDSSLNPEQQEYLATIRECSLANFERVQDILTFAKISMSDIQPHLSPFNPATLILRLTGKVNAPAPVQLITDLPDNLPELVIAPANEIRIILQKLLYNALKFTERGEVRLSVTSRFNGPHSVLLSFAISDTGPGIRPDLIETGALFDPFTQADSSLKRRHQGLGLGLSLCKMVAERIGGTLTVNSQPDKGSTFKLELTAELQSS